MSSVSEGSCLLILFASLTGTCCTPGFVLGLQPPGAAYLLVQQGPQTEEKWQVLRRRGRGQREIQEDSGLQTVLSPLVLSLMVSRAFPGVGLEGVTWTSP